MIELGQQELYVGNLMIIESDKQSVNHSKFGIESKSVFNLHFYHKHSAWILL